MNILIIDANSFVGENFCSQLENIANKKARWYKVNPGFTVWKCEQGIKEGELDLYCEKADFVFILTGQVDSILSALKRYNNTCPVMFASSSQAAFDTSEGATLRNQEEQLFNYADKTGAKVLIYRFPEIFGKWNKTKSDKSVSRLCYDVANSIPRTIDNQDEIVSLVYIDDVVDELIGALTGDEFREGKYCYVPHVHKIRLGDIADLLYSFDEGRPSPNLQIPYVSDSFRKALYSTYTSYLPKEKISYPLEMKKDDRGSFTEFIHTENHGQVSINISKPGITKGQHWHHNLVERFLVVSGHGLIQLRKEGVDENGNKYPVLNYEVSGDKLEVVEMIAGYTHNLINLSDTEDMVTVIWANACFDPNRPDTYFDPVE